MKYVRTTLLLALLLGMSLAAYDVKKPMTKEEIDVMEQQMKLAPFTVRMDRPSVKSVRTVITGETRAALSEGFELAVPPMGWLIRNVNADPSDTVQQTSYASHSGSYSCQFSSYNTFNADEWLITPPLIVTAAGADTIRWWWYTDGDAEDMQILVSTDTALSSFSDTLIDITVTLSSWDSAAVSLDSYGDDTVYVAFRYISDYMYYLYLDDVTGPEAIIPQDTIGPAISILEYPVSHFAMAEDDSVIARVVDPAGVDSAFLYYYVASWNKLTMNIIGTDSFTAAIPAQPRGTTVYWYIEAYDGLGNVSTDPIAPYVYAYGIYPSSENLVVYATTTVGQELIDAFDNLGYTYDVMDDGDFEDYADSIAPIWSQLWWAETYSITDSAQKVIEGFISYSSGADSSDRYTLFLSGDDIAYSSESNDFVERIFRCDYIQDDLSSSDDIDTVVGIPGDPISNGMPSYTFDSDYPDFVVPTAWATGDPIDEIDASSAFQLIADGDGGAWGDTTPGGLGYSGLTWIGAYIPYEMDDFEDNAARDTLIRRLMEVIPAIPMPPFVDACILESGSAAGVVGNLSTEIIGYAYEPGGSIGDFTPQVGMGPVGSDLPESDTLWLWFNAAFESSSNDTFEFIGQIDIPGTTTPGVYSIAYRYSYDKGPWIYADLDGFSRGFAYQFDPAMAGTLTVVAPPPTVVINEVYYDSPGGDTSLYTELYGAPGTSLDSFKLVGVNGNGGAVYNIIPLDGGIIPVDSFFVVCTAARPYTDLVADVDWQNGDDNVLLTYVYGAASVTIDAVGYGTYDTTSWTFVGEGMPVCDVKAGHSFYRGPDGTDTDNNIADFVASGILTPGDNNFGPPSVVTIADIQGGDTITPYLDSIVWGHGIVTASDGYYIFLQDVSGPWNGVRIEVQDYPVSMGDSILFIFSPIEDNNETRLADRAMPQIFGTGTIPAPYQTTPGDIDANEANEGVLVELNLVTVVDDDAGYGEWIVSDGVDSCLVDDYYGYTTPDSGTVLSILRGPVSYSYGDYKIEPRGDWDMFSFDVLITLGFAPDTINSSTPVSPWAFIGTNLDAPEDSFYTYFEVDTGAITIHRDSVYDWIGSGIKQVVFTDWTPGFEGDMTFRYYTALPFDVDPTNDVKEYPIVSSGVGEISDIPTVFNLTVPGISVSMSSIKYAVPERAKVSISLFDRLGRRMVLVDKVHTPGYYEVHLDKMNIPSGVYFIRMKSSSFSDQKKMVLVK